jgi:hypothetical protein
LRLHPTSRSSPPSRTSSALPGAGLWYRPTCSLSAPSVWAADGKKSLCLRRQADVRFPKRRLAERMARLVASARKRRIQARLQLPLGYGCGSFGQPTPNLSGETHSSLSSVSCTSATACSAVGTYWTLGANVTLAEAWNGTKWAVQATPNPAGALNTYLDAVSCSSATACAAVGNYVVSNPFYQGLAELWNETDWTIERTPSPTPGASEISLDAVACYSNNFCIAVESYQNRSGIELTLAEKWNGEKCVVQSTPNPKREEVSSLTGISCTSATSCIAVGLCADISGVQHVPRSAKLRRPRSPKPGPGRSGCSNPLPLCPGAATWPVWRPPRRSRAPLPANPDQRRLPRLGMGGSGWCRSPLRSMAMAISAGCHAPLPLLVPQWARRRTSPGRS